MSELEEERPALPRGATAWVQSPRAQSAAVVAVEEFDAELDETGEPLEFDVVDQAKSRRVPKITTKQAIEHYGKQPSENLIYQEKTKAHLANREIIRRLMKYPAKVRLGELNFIAGTSMDKIAKKERWDKAGEQDAKTWTTQFVEAIKSLQADTTMRLSLEVARGPAEPLQVMPAIDVVAVPEGMETKDAGALSTSG